MIGVAMVLAVWLCGGLDGCAGNCLVESKGTVESDGLGK